MKNELQRLKKLGVIKPVVTPTDWVSSLVIVKKPSGKIRLCIDPKPLNKALKRCHYPLPIIEDLLPELSKAKVFSKCDAKNGFWHVTLDEQSSFLTTFETPFGRFRWLKMPFGISPAPEYLQQFLERDPPLFTGKLLIIFQNILRNTTHVIIRHRVKILFSIISSPITLERQK